MSKTGHLFRRTSIVGEDGRRRSAYVLTCECGQMDSIRVGSSIAIEMPDDVVRRKFQQRGWQVDKTKYRCPTCIGTNAKRHA